MGMIMTLNFLTSNFSSTTAILLVNVYLFVYYLMDRFDLIR